MRQEPILTDGFYPEPPSITPTEVLQVVVISLVAGLLSIAGGLAVLFR